MAERCMMDPSRDCIGLAKAEMLEKQMDEYRRQAHSTYIEMFERIRKLEDDRTEIKTQYGHIMELLGGMKADISALKEKPARRWESIVTAVITGVVGVVLGLLFAVQI